jgi:hypothetical protein
MPLSNAVDKLLILGLIGMQLNLPDSGTFLFISDHCHVIENVSGLHTPGHRDRQLLTRDTFPSGVTVSHRAG